MASKLDEKRGQVLKAYLHYDSPEPGHMDEGKVMEMVSILQGFPYLGCSFLKLVYRARRNSGRVSDEGRRFT